METEVNIQRPLEYDHDLACDICWEVATTPYSFDELRKKYEHWPTRETTIQWAREHSEFAELLLEALERKDELLSHAIEIKKKRANKGH